MKVLIAYDGSESSDAALEDLKRAGLPTQLEALVISVADVFMPPSATDDEAEAMPVLPEVRRALKRAEQKLFEAKACATSAAEKLKLLFP